MDSNGTMILSLIVLIALSAFFSASETAYTSLNRVRVKSLANAGNRRAGKVLKLSENYDKLLADIKNFYRTHRSCINDVDPESIKNIRKACYEIVCTEKYKYEDPKNPTEVKLKEKYPSFWDWVDEMDEKMEEEEK